MRIIIVLLLVVLSCGTSLSQQKVQKEIKKPLPDEVPSKKQIQGQMAGAINELNTQIADLEKQLAEAIANKEDEETIKGYRDQIAMLKKQVEMMGGVSKTMSGFSEKTFQQAGEKEPLVPKKDLARIKMIPKEILTEAQLSLLITNVHAQVEKMILSEEKAEALIMYNETKTKHNSSDITGNLANSCWMLGHSEKALYIMGRACLDDISNTDNLNNYAAFLVMSGGEQAALPILEYLNSLFPENSTILNNIGQAWFGLGDLKKSEEYLKEATSLSPTHSMANNTLADISLSNGDSPATIAFLKASLKESYDPDKEAQLTSLGYTIKFADLPPLNYPIQDDPFGLIPMIKTIPETIQTDVNDARPAIVMLAYNKGTKKLGEMLGGQLKVLQSELRKRDNKLSTDPQKRKKVLEPHNSPAYKLAARGLQLRTIEAMSVPVTGSIDNFPVEKIIENCQKLWNDSVLIPINALIFSPGFGNKCENADAAMNAFLQKKQEIYSRGAKLIKEMYIKNSLRLTDYIKYKLYGEGADDPPRDIDDLTYSLIGEMSVTQGRSAIENKEYRDLLIIMNNSTANFQNIFRSQCQPQPPDPDPNADNLIPLIKTRVECEFKKKVNASEKFQFELVCNTVIEKTDPKLQKRKSRNKRGNAKSAPPTTPTHQISSRLPLFGPSYLFFENETEIINQKVAPLNTEKKHPAQFSIEYDRWGNLLSLDFQLNKDGTALADTDSKVSGINSRWSWNAAGTATKGFLNKLVIK